MGRRLSVSDAGGAVFPKHLLFIDSLEVIEQLVIAIKMVKRIT
jgi:hypothetical protein